MQSIAVLVVVTMLISGGAAKYSERQREAAKHCNKDGDKNDEKQCYSFCAIKAYRMVNDKGKINYSNFRDEQQAMVKKCDENNKQVNVCERAESLEKCLRKVSKRRHITNEKLSIECAKDTNTEVTERNMKNIRKYIFDDKKACFQRCMLIKLGWINVANEINSSKMPQKLGNDQVDRDELIKKCTGGHSEADKCIQAIGRAKCVIDIMLED